MSLDVKVIAFYLPQYHPIPENNEWWGEGFTEWTNVGRARPLFKGHYQPRVPSVLGYYDLRIPEVREKQAELAKEAGIEAFCYWHYWFGEGRQILEMPIKEVIKTKKPNFPFCISWANHSWINTSWSAEVRRLSKKTLLQQKYLGRKDYELFFYSLLEAFQDNRYYKIDGKLCFVVYDVTTIPDFDVFIETWRELAVKNNLPEFFFVAHTPNPHYSHENFSLCDAVNLTTLGQALKSGRPSIARHNRIISYFYTKYETIVGDYTSRPKTVVSYKQAIPYLTHQSFSENFVFPTIYPNWDSSPRRGGAAGILTGSTPALFKEHIKRVLKTVKDKPEALKIVFLKSWNEWAEGNYMEPDLKFGKQYIEALNQALKG